MDNCYYLLFLGLKTEVTRSIGSRCCNAKCVTVVAALVLAVPPCNPRVKYSCLKIITSNYCLSALKLVTAAVIVVFDLVQLVRRKEPALHVGFVCLLEESKLQFTI